MPKHGGNPKQQLEAAFYNAIRRKLGVLPDIAPAVVAAPKAKPTKPPMAKRGIAFSGPLVHAMLQGRKNQTRRPVNPPVARPVARPDVADCRIAQPGDWLLVREPWRRTEDGYEYAGDHPGRRGFKAGRYMPRDAGRLLLHVSAVEVQRAQSITDKDARMEGMPTDVLVGPRDWFAAVWSNFYDGPLAWSANPWVWVVRFDLFDLDGNKKGVPA